MKRGNLSTIIRHRCWRVFIFFTLLFITDSLLRWWEGAYSWWWSTNKHSLATRNYTLKLLSQSLLHQHIWTYQGTRCIIDCPWLICFFIDKICCLFSSLNQCCFGFLASDACNLFRYLFLWLNCTAACNLRKCQTLEVNTCKACEGLHDTH